MSKRRPRAGLHISPSSHTRAANSCPRRRGRKVLFSELNPLNPSRTNRKQKQRRSRGQKPHGGASAGVSGWRKKQGCSCNDAQIRPSFCSRITFTHFCQRPKETGDRCSRFLGGSVNAPSETPPASWLMRMVKVTVV